MVSTTLLLYCILFAGLYHVISSILLGVLERKLNLCKGIPNEMLEESSMFWSGANIIMEGLFIVVIPAIGYSFFYLVVPLNGIKAGMGAALFAFILGAAPAIMGLSVRLKLPMPFLLFSLLSLLIRLGGSLAIIGYLYSI